ncbi:MAG: glucosamine-6-phosphate deaminase, partial [Planctomycetia bacterium]
AARFANFVADFNNLFQLDCDRTLEIEKKIHDFLKAKTTGQVDCDEVLALKALVRKTEATAGAAVIGIGEELLHFLDLPFYRTGRAAKNPPGEADVSRVYDLLKALKPAQIYVAGDLADPHGTHRLCALVCFQAVERYRAAGGVIEVWLYRGAWQEWEPHQIERVVPLSPEDMELKKAAIFRHQSQKDGAMFLGRDTREFWQRAEERNRGTAAMYDRLGLPEYYAMEGFVKWNGEMP